MFGCGEKKGRERICLVRFSAKNSHSLWNITLNKTRRMTVPFGQSFFVLLDSCLFFDYLNLFHVCCAAITIRLCFVCCGCVSQVSKSCFVSSDSDVRAPDFVEKAKETIEKIIHHDNSPHHHHKETHGMSDDIDESTPIDEVKGPSIFERAKEEFEAVFQAIHPKKKD